MKKTLIWNAFLVIALYFGPITTAIALDVISGNVIKLDKNMVTVEDNQSAEQVRVHYDSKTAIHGQLKNGAFVEVELNGDHALSIEVIDTMSDEESGMDSDEGSEEGMEEGQSDF